MPALSLQSRVARAVIPGFFRTTVKPLWGSPLPVTWQRSITNKLLSGPLTRLLVPGGVTIGSVQRHGVATEVITPKAGASDQVVYFLHGGGYVLCTPQTHRPLTARLALALNATTYVPDYRLAPEHPFPAALDDALAGYEALLAQGIAADKIVMMGDSAGGGLALATALAIRDRGLPLPRQLVLISPWTDLTQSGASIALKAGVDAVLSEAWLKAKIRDYAGNTPVDHPLVSPLFADLRGLPPTLVQVGTEEVLFSDSERLAERAGAAGWPLQLQVYEGLWHDFQLFAAVLPEAAEAVAEIVAFVRQ